MPNKTKVKKTKIYKQTEEGKLDNREILNIVDRMIREDLKRKHINYKELLI